MVFCLGSEGFIGYLFRNGWFQCFLVQELKFPKIPCLEMGGSNVCSVQQLMVPKVPYLKWVVPMVYCLGSEGANGSLFRNGQFQWFSVQELKVPKVPYLEMVGSNVFLGMNFRFPRFPIQKWVVPMFLDRKSTRLNSSHMSESRMPSSA